MTSVLGLQITLFTVDGKTVFDIPGKGEISYLVCHDWAAGKHHSYGFEPSKMTEEHARNNFLCELEANRATPYNPDGGRLDGKDL